MDGKRKQWSRHSIPMAALSAVLLAPTGAAAQTYPEGMVSYWKFDEGAGTAAYDSVGTNDGVIVGGASWTAGRVGGALMFDGDDYVEVPDDPSLRGMSELTVEAWAFPTTVSPQWQGIVVKRDHYHPADKHTYHIGIWRNWELLPPYPYFSVFNDAAAEGAVHCTEDVLSSHRWYHLAGVYDGFTVELYVNGSFCGETPFVGADVRDAPHRFLIGAYAYTWGQGFHFNGIIDEVAIYGRALAPEEIDRHYHNGLLGLGYELGCTDPDPASQGYWHRQCLGLPAGDPDCPGIDPGRFGRGPEEPTEPGFCPDLMACADARLEDLGFYGMDTCEGMDADPASDDCERARKQLTALVLNVCSERLADACEVDVGTEGCSSTTVGDLIEEVAGLIENGPCGRAADCAAAVNDGSALAGDAGGRDSPDLLTPQTHDRPGPKGRDRRVRR